LGNVVQALFPIVWFNESQWFKIILLLAVFEGLLNHVVEISNILDEFRYISTLDIFNNVCSDLDNLTDIINTLLPIVDIWKINISFFTAISDGLLDCTVKFSDILNKLSKFEGFDIIDDFSS
jgi:hypothetical protein